MRQPDQNLTRFSSLNCENLALESSYPLGYFQKIIVHEDELSVASQLSAAQIKRKVICYQLEFEKKLNFQLNSPFFIRVNLQITFLSIFDSTRYIYTCLQKAAELLHQNLTKCFLSCTYYSHILIFHCHFQQLTYSVRWRTVLRLLMHKEVTSLQSITALPNSGLLHKCTLKNINNK